MYAQVMVDIAHANVDRLFTYAVPPGMAVEPGQRVLAPFGADSKMRADLAFVRKLFALGRASGQEWLAAHRKDVGVRPTIQIADNA